MCRQIESMAASAAAQQAGHAEAEQQLIQRLKTVEAALSEARESEQALRVSAPEDPLLMTQDQGPSAVYLQFPSPDNVHDCQAVMSLSL